MTNSKLPSYITKYSYSEEELYSILKEGRIQSQLNESGILELSSDIKKSLRDASVSIEIDDPSKSLISIPVFNQDFDNVKIESFLDIEFQDFVEESPFNTSGSEDTIRRLNQEIERQAELIEQQQTIFNEFIQGNEDRYVEFVENANDKYNNSRDLIVSLRIQNGEGTSEEQFSKKFPFERVDETVRETETPDEFPFISYTEINSGSGDNE